MIENQEDPQSSISFLELPFKRKNSLSINEPYFKKLEGIDEKMSEVIDPKIMNPKINPQIRNPEIMNPEIMNPEIMNPEIMNPENNYKTNLNSTTQNIFIDPIFADLLISIPNIFDKMLKKEQPPFVYERGNKNILSIFNTRNGEKIKIPVLEYKYFYKYLKNADKEYDCVKNPDNPFKNDQNIDFMNLLKSDKKIRFIILLQKKSFLRKEQKKETERYKKHVLNQEKYVPNIIKGDDYIFQLNNNVNIFYIDQTNELARVIKNIVRKSDFVPKVKISKNSQEFIENFLNSIPGISQENSKSLSLKFKNLKDLKNVKNEDLSIEDLNRKKRVLAKILRILNSYDENERIGL
ncbi:hypothetical protein DMUE_1386 [Dictyocoela muelleri]|nr:hypothetical protein DMUE_1386 [Dictyocoela muelleri]